MHATPEGTRRLADEADLAEVGYTSLGRSDLVASRVGFGTYRVDERSTEHRQALIAALLEGVNLVDTSTNYGDGGAERLVGSVLAELFAAGKITRDGVVIVSKAGFAQGAMLEEVRGHEPGYPGMITLGPDVAHGLHPRFLTDQLAGSLSRLGLDRIDAYLLHNPETFLAHGRRPRADELPEPEERRRAELDRRIAEAFEALEVAHEAGKISWYGVSSNAFGLPAGAPDATSVSRMIAIAGDVARRRGRSEHHLGFIELPLNLRESGAARFKTEDGRTPIEAAREAGLAVLANRPLNAFHGDRLVRLAAPPPPPTAPPLAEAADEVEAIETVFVQDFAPRIKVEGDGPTPDALFQWGRELAQAPGRVAGLDHWLAIQSQVIAPQVNATLPRLVEAFAGDPAFDAWAMRYKTALQELLAAVTAEIVKLAAREIEGLDRKLEAAVPAWSRASLSRRAIGTVMWTPGVSSVLVGMRRRSYVEDALGAVGLPALDERGAAPVYEALST